MSPFDLIELLRIRPFQPFRIYASDGRTYDIHHPEPLEEMVRTRAAWARPGRNADGREAFQHHEAHQPREHRSCERRRIPRPNVVTRDHEVSSGKSQVYFCYSGTSGKYPYCVPQ
jgi:hypothetical protein